MLKLRQPRAMSPTSLHLFEWNREEYALRYLVDPSPPRPEQTPAMALGSGFDAFVKASLYEHFYGKNKDYALTNLFNTQVEEHVYEKVYNHSADLFILYKRSGAYQLLLKELEAWGAPPRFEVGINRVIGGVPIYGKPDLYFINKLGIKIIYDWKVNGYFSASNTSPMKGYTWCWDPTKGICAHKTCEPCDYYGVTINKQFFMEDCDKKWADQLAMYSWLMGNPVGSTRCVFGIDQIVGRPEKLRICRHRLRISPEWQLDLLARLQTAWHAIVNEQVIPPEELELMCGTDDQFTGVISII